MASVSNWNVEILQRAAAGPRTAVRDIPQSELGAIDREPQRAALEAALLAVEESPDPGICVAIHGAEDAGQFAFLSFLEQWNPWNISGKPRSITPSLDRFDVASLTAAALADIAPSQASGTTTIDDLAASLVDRSELEPVVMFFAHLPRLVGGLEAFYQQFWTPLVAAARARRDLVAAPRKPFVLVLPLNAPWRDPLPPMLQAYREGASASAPPFAFDFNRVILLPELGTFTSAHVARWLESVGIKNLKERKRIADSVTADGVPRARLRSTQQLTASGPPFHGDTHGVRGIQRRPISFLRGRAARRGDRQLRHRAGPSNPGRRRAGLRQDDAGPRDCATS